MRSGFDGSIGPLCKAPQHLVMSVLQVGLGVKGTAAGSRLAVGNSKLMAQMCKASKALMAGETDWAQKGEW